MPGRVVDAGDGGGEVINGVWTHSRYIDEEVAALARQVVEGHRQRLPGLLLRQRRAERLAQRRERREGQPPVVVQGAVLPWDFDVLEPVVPFPDTED